MVPYLAQLLGRYLPKGTHEKVRYLVTHVEHWLNVRQTYTVLQLTVKVKYTVKYTVKNMIKDIAKDTVKHKVKYKTKLIAYFN